MQYSLDGNFQMLPIKLYPSFIPRHNYKKLELTLNCHCRLPTTLRCKWLKISFTFPTKVQKIFFTNINNSEEQLEITDIHDVESLKRVANSWISNAISYAGGSPTKNTDNGTADVDMNKRKVEWTIKNFKGGTNKTLEISLSYGKDVLIDELQFK